MTDVEVRVNPNSVSIEMEVVLPAPLTPKQGRRFRVR